MAAKMNFNSALQSHEGNIFVPCKACNMFRLMKPEQFNFLKKHYHDPKQPAVVHCMSCQDKMTLLRQIDDLNNTIFNQTDTIAELNERIANLIHIRDCENVLDTTIDNLAQKFDQLQVNNNYTVPPAVTEEIVEQENPNLPPCCH